METQRMVLRRFTESDVDDLVQLNADPAVMRYIGDGRPMTRQAVTADLPKYFTDDFLVALDKESGKFLGWFELRALADRTAELGYRLRSDAWGRGLATEGSRTLIAHGFAERGLRTIWAETMAVNRGSRRVMEKCGLRYARTYFQDWDDPIPGSELGEVVYELTREEWLTAR